MLTVVLIFRNTSQIHPTAPETYHVSAHADFVSPENRHIPYKQTAPSQRRLTNRILQPASPQSLRFRLILDLNHAPARASVLQHFKCWIYVDRPQTMSQHRNGIQNESEVRPLSPLWLNTALTTLLLVIAVPLFVCSPVTSDTSLFDVQAMTVQNGGILYRDIIEPNLPGIVWIHLALRTIIGWSSEAIRMADLGIFLVTMILLSNIVGAAGNQIHKGSRIGLLIFTCTLFYVTRNEWCHCQRDIWMLLPVSCAMWLRSTRIHEQWQDGARCHSPCTDKASRNSDNFQRSDQTGLPPFFSKVVEGVFWGIAFWIKPHVAVPALSVFAIDAVRISSWNLRAREIGSVILGGLLAAVPGVVWLISTGAWDHFWDMMLEWNPEYLEAGRDRRSWSRLGLLLERFHPWWTIHLIAVPMAIQSIVEGVRNRFEPDNDKSAVRNILGICYLSWMMQTFLLQHAMDYIHVPEVILACCVVAAYPWQLDLQLRRVFVAALLGLGLLAAPIFYGGRLSVWQRCFREGSSPEVRSILAQGNYPNWQHLAQVKKFLKSQNIADGDVACLNVHSIHLHQELSVLPATRYWSIICPLTMFPRRYDEIMASVNSGHQRFIVVEANETNHEEQILPGSFPNDYPVVFESGTYRIHDSSPTAMGRITAAQ